MAEASSPSRWWPLLSRLTQHRPPGTSITAALPCDTSLNPEPRRVFAKVSCRVTPTKDPSLALAAVSGACCKHLGSGSSRAGQLVSVRDVVESSMEFSCGGGGGGADPSRQFIASSSSSFSTCYTGFQFDKMVGQLGDGRSVCIVEGAVPASATEPEPTFDRQRRNRGEDERDEEDQVKKISKRPRLFEIQLKGGTKTPFSRRFDGRLVYSSAVKEFLVSETLAHWTGFERRTSRGLALWHSTDHTAHRDGLPPQPTAILARVMTSSLRIGTLENSYYTGKHDVLLNTVNYAIRTHWPLVWDTHALKAPEQQAPKDEQQGLLLALSQLQPRRMYLEWMGLVIKGFASMVAAWDAQGFVHGVMNTDNFSLHGETIDYGPFCFIDYYDRSYVHNEDDDHGLYCYGQQFASGKKNAERFALCVSPCLGVVTASSASSGGQKPPFTPIEEQEQVKQEYSKIISRYDDHYAETYSHIMSTKLGLDPAASRETRDAVIKATVAYLDSSSPKDGTSQANPRYHTFFACLAQARRTTTHCDEMLRELFGLLVANDNIAEEGDSVLFIQRPQAHQRTTLTPDRDFEEWAKVFSSVAFSDAPPPNPTMLPSLSFLNAVAAASLAKEETGRNEEDEARNYGVIADALSVLRRSSQGELVPVDDPVRLRLFATLQPFLRLSADGEDAVQDCGCG